MHSFYQPTVNVPTNGRYSWWCCRRISYRKSFIRFFITLQSKKNVTNMNSLVFIDIIHRGIRLDTLSRDYSPAGVTRKRQNQLLQLNQHTNSQLINSNNNHKRMALARGKSSNSCNVLRIKLTSHCAKDSTKLFVNAKPNTICFRSIILFIEQMNKIHFCQI